MCINLTCLGPSDIEQQTRYSVALSLVSSSKRYQFLNCVCVSVIGFSVVNRISNVWGKEGEGGGSK